MTAIELTPKDLALIDQVTAADAQAELERRAKPKKERGKAASEAARQLFAPVLRQIAGGNTVVVARTPETSVPAEVTATIHQMPEVVATPVEEPTAPIAPIVPITQARKPKAPKPPVKRELVLGALTPIVRTNRAPEFSLSMTDLVETLKAIEAPAKGKSFLPTLSCVVAQAEADTVTLTTTNLDVTMQVQLPGKVNVEGAVAIPLAELKKLLPTAKRNQVGDVNVRVVDDEVHVTSGSLTSTLHSPDLTDFPELRVSPDEGTVFELDLDAIASVLTAVAKEESRPILTGILFDGNVVVATDSYRLNESTTCATVDKPMLVPGSFLAGLVKRGKKAIARATATDLLVTDEDGMVMVSRLIDGQYPNYKSLFPASTPERITFDTDEMAAALTGFLARKPASTTPVRMVGTSGGKLALRMFETDRWDATVEITGTAPFEVGFNPRYLRDLLIGGIDHLNLVDALKPCVTERTVAGRQERRMLMPVRLNS